MTGISALPPAKLAAHEAAVARLRDAYAAVPPGVPVRLAKPTSNLFRFRDSAKPGSAAERVSLDVSAFARVIHVDAASRDRGRRRHDHLPGSLRRHAAARAHAAGRPAAQDDHPGRRGHRPRHRVDVALARAAARVRHRDADPHRRRLGRRRDQGQRAQRPVLRLPELLRHPRLLAGPHHRADAGQAVRPPAPLRLQRPEELHGRDRRDRRGRELPRAQGGLRRRHRVQQQRAVPERRGVQRQGALAQRLHRPAGLLQVDADQSGGLPHDQGLHLALGHRLVLVLPPVRRAEQQAPPVLAAASTAARTSTASSSRSTRSTA